jgi:hypothetical protein
MITRHAYREEGTGKLFQQSEQIEQKYRARKSVR